MNNSPLVTMAGNSVSRNTNDSSYSERIGDSTDGAMGTHINNRHGLASNAVSDYNQASMTDIQQNLNMIDATRGYGGHDVNSNELYSADNGSGMGSLDYSGNSSNASHPSMSASRAGTNSVYDNVSQDVSGGGGFTGITSASSSLFDKAPSSGVPVTTAISVLLKPKSRINTDLNSDNDAVPTGAGLKSNPVSKKPLEDIDESEDDTLVKQGIGKSSGAGSLRPFEKQNVYISYKTDKKKEISSTEKAMVKLSKLSNDELLLVVEATVYAVENATSNRDKIIQSCKLGFLEKETTRRFEKS